MDNHRMPLTFPSQTELGENFHTITSQDDGPVNWSRIVDGQHEAMCDFDLRPTENGPPPLTCNQCPHSLAPWTDRVSVPRKCGTCGELRYEASQDPATGPVVRKGEQFIIPADLFRRNMCLTGGASFSRKGVDWLARQIFSGPIGFTPSSINHFKDGLKSLAEQAESVLSDCSSIAGIDRTTVEGEAATLKVLATNISDPAFAALVLKIKAESTAEILATAAETDDVSSIAMWAWAAGVNAALMHFQLHFANAAFQGNSLEKIHWLISEWTRNQNNNSEAFWQELLLSRPIALSQLFASPVVIHGERFFVGGVHAGGQHGKIVDYLLRNQLTDAAVIVELKTPTAVLLYESPYRGDVFAPHRELSGAVQQVLEQRAQFMKHMQALQAELEVTEPRVEIVEPHCVVIMGHTNQLDTKARRRSFEAYRTELRNVRIVTFDEMFAKLTGLAGLLGGHFETNPA